MQANIDHSVAQTMLKQAFVSASSEAYKPLSRDHETLKKIITGSHLTFRYILITAILAKATNSKANTLSLQAGADLDGAYDARSLCHDVIVPFERINLKNGLGGSNEPFLNKPARYKAISLTNAVRRGEDLRLLQTLYSFLPKITSSAEAQKCLADCVHFALQRAKNTLTSESHIIVTTGGRLDILSFIETFVAESLEGETCALVVGTLIQCQFGEISKDVEIKVHPVNQCGASSNEVSDVDVYFSSDLAATIEVKDKIFTVDDVGHAIRKVKESGFDSLMFITGPRGQTTESVYAEARKMARDLGIHVSFASLINFANTTLAGPGQWEASVFLKRLIGHSIRARCKDATKARVTLVSKNMGWI